MDRSGQNDAYRAAFKQAQALFSQLSLELDALGCRQAALLSATKALEGFISKRLTEPATESQNAPAPTVQMIHASSPDRPQTHHPISQTYVHRKDDQGELQRRIDLAIGR